ncbi:MAG: hypothetical protein J7621_26510 [Niastella sp.]|nr:hypothetical protein [Niastella sp.]
MRKKFFLRTFIILVVLTAGILVVAATRAGKTTDEEVCSESKDQCEKPKAQGEFIILEALNRAVMVTAR